MTGRARSKRLGLVLGTVAGLTGLLLTVSSAGAALNWTIPTTPNHSNTNANDHFNAVSCASPSFCFAVGAYFDGTRQQALIEKWDGTSWTIVSSVPDVMVSGNEVDNLLFGVSCASATFCVAVGHYNVDFVGTRTLAMLWNGSAWSLSASGNKLCECGFLDQLMAVSCASSTFCVAVGNWFDGTDFQTLIEESSDGATFTVVSSPNATDANNMDAEINNSLFGVSCPSTTFCAAVGNDAPQSANSTLIEHRSADGWAIVPSTNGGSNVNELFGVSCVGSSAASSFCAAVGRQDNPFATLIEHWNGSVWGTPVTSPDPGTTANQLLAVTCLSSSFCAAAGSQRSGSGANQTLIAEYDGTAWTADTTPNQNPDGTDADTLAGASCVSTNTFCVAAGDYGLPNEGPTLILQAFIPPPTPTPTPTPTSAVAASVPVPAVGAQGSGGGWVAGVYVVLGSGLVLTAAAAAWMRRRPR